VRKWAVAVGVREKIRESPQSHWIREEKKNMLFYYPSPLQLRLKKMGCPRWTGERRGGKGRGEKSTPLLLTLPYSGKKKGREERSLSFILR